MAGSAYDDAATIALPSFVQEYLSEREAVGRFPRSIVVHPFQGYADRMKGVVTAFLMAVLTKRNLYVRWPYLPQLDTVIEPRLTPWDEAPPETTFSRWWLKHEFAKDFPGSGDLAAWIDETVFENHDVALLECNQNFIPHFTAWLNAIDPGRELRSGPLFQALFHALFRLKPESAIQDSVDALRQPLRDRFVIGVHIRAGSNGQWKDPEFETEETLTRYETAVQSFVEANGHANPAIYLSTDSAKVKDKIRAGEMFREFEVFQQDIVPFHVRYVGRANANVLRETIIDHYALSCCDHIFRGKGEFALTAAMIGGVSIEAA